MTADYREVTVAQVRLRYLELEPDQTTAAPPLLLLHSLLTTAENLSVLISHLPKGKRRIVALDLLSAEPEHSAALDMHSEALANMVAAFARVIGLVRPVVLGHSYGGTLALRLAAAQGSDVGGLVLLCPAHPFGGYSSQVVSFYITRWGRLCGLGVSLFPRWLLRYACNQAAGTASPITPAHLQTYMRVLRSRRSLRRVLAMLQSWEADMGQLREQLVRAPIVQPSLLIWGDEDTIVPLVSAAALREHLTRSELIPLSRRGHLLVDEAPEECGDHIGEWLSRGGL